ncbi:hypothetical protein AB0B50_34855 [Streptomyces sp. NPDC041068]|uniref:hypothetical protein n=1 Tax=Streptomyces sp. NPDC041068 TaxID=3155130 RepID=UPI0033ED5F3E
MEAGDYITAANSAVAGGAVAVAWWQARVAKQATNAQLEAQRAQRDQARDERDKADCPRFIVQETDVRGGEGAALEVIAVIKQTAGSDLDEARVTVHLNHEPARVIGGAEDGTLLWPHTGINAMRHLKLLAPDGHRGLLEIRADLVCREAGGERTWTCRVFGYPQAEWEQILENAASPSATDDTDDQVTDTTDTTDTTDAAHTTEAAEPRGRRAARDTPTPLSSLHTTPTRPATPHPPSAALRRELQAMTHWRTTLPHFPDDAHRLPFPEAVYPTLVHPEDIGMLAVTPVLTSTAGRSDLEDGIW